MKILRSFLLALSFCAAALPCLAGSSAPPLLRELPDVRITAPLGSGDVITWNGTRWVNGTGNTNLGVTGWWATNYISNAVQVASNGVYGAGTNWVTNWVIGRYIRNTNGIGTNLTAYGYILLNSGDIRAEAGNFVFGDSSPLRIYGTMGDPVISDNGFWITNGGIIWPATTCYVTNKNEDLIFGGPVDFGAWFYGNIHGNNDIFANGTVYAPIAQFTNLWVWSNLYVPPNGFVIVTNKTAGTTFKVDSQKQLVQLGSGNDGVSIVATNTNSFNFVTNATDDNRVLRWLDSTNTAGLATNLPVWFVTDLTVTNYVTVLGTNTAGYFIGDGGGLTNITSTLTNLMGDGIQITNLSGTNIVGLLTNDTTGQASRLQLGLQSSLIDYGPILANAAGSSFVRSDAFRYTNSVVESGVDWILTNNLTVSNIAADIITVTSLTVQGTITSTNLEARLSSTSNGVMNTASNYTYGVSNTLVGISNAVLNTSSNYTHAVSNVAYTASNSLNGLVVSSSNAAFMAGTNYTITNWNQAILDTTNNVNTVIASASNSAFMAGTNYAVTNFNAAILTTTNNFKLTDLKNGTNAAIAKAQADITSATNDVVSGPLRSATNNLRNALTKVYATNTQRYLLAPGSVTSTVANAMVLVQGVGITLTTNNGTNLVVTATTNVTGDAIVTGNLTVDNTVTASNLWDRSNVKWWGAKGDGVTDDTAAIQAALNAVSNVYLPSGTYAVTGLLMNANFRSLHGEGPDASILQSTSTNAAITISNRGSRIERLGILGKTNVGVTGTSYGIHIPRSGGSTWENTIENVTVSRCQGVPGYGISSEAWSMQILECQSSFNNWGIVIAGPDCTKTTIRGCSLEFNVTGQFWASGNTLGLNLFKNNIQSWDADLGLGDTWEYTNQIGVFLEGTAGVTMIGNYHETGSSPNDIDLLICSNSIVDIIQMYAQGNGWSRAALVCGTNFTGRVKIDGLIYTNYLGESFTNSGSGLLEYQNVCANGMWKTNLLAGGIMDSDVQVNGNAVVETNLTARQGLIATNVNLTGATNWGSGGGTNYTTTGPNGWLNTNTSGGYVNIKNGTVTLFGTASVSTNDNPGGWTIYPTNDGSLRITQPSGGAGLIGVHIKTNALGTIAAAVIDSPADSYDLNLADRGQKRWALSSGHLLPFSNYDIGQDGYRVRSICTSNLYTINAISSNGLTLPPLSAAPANLASITNGWSMTWNSNGYIYRTTGPVGYTTNKTTLVEEP